MKTYKMPPRRVRGFSERQWPKNWLVSRTPANSSATHPSSSTLREAACGRRLWSRGIDVSGGGCGRAGSTSRVATSVRRVVVWQNARSESVGPCDDEVRPVLWDGAEACRFAKLEPRV